MAHGKTLALRKIGRPEPQYVKAYVVERNKRKRLVKVGDWTPYVGASRDRSLAGKSRIRARRAAR